MSQRYLCIILFFVIMVLFSGCTQKESQSIKNSQSGKVEIYYKSAWKGTIDDGLSSHSINGSGSKSEFVESSKGTISVKVQKLDESRELLTACITGKCQSTSSPYGTVSFTQKL